MINIQFEYYVLNHNFNRDKRELFNIFNNYYVQYQTEKEIKKAVKIAWQYAQYDGSHHKMWVIDQMVRVLLGETEYRNFIDAYQTPDGEDYYTWDMGIAP